MLFRCDAGQRGGPEKMRASSGQKRQSMRQRRGVAPIRHRRAFLLARNANYAERLIEVPYSGKSRTGIKGDDVKGASEALQGG